MKEDHAWSLDEEIHWEETYIKKQEEFLLRKREELDCHKIRLEELYRRRCIIDKIIDFLTFKWLY
jgi:hypothetical protein